MIQPANRVAATVLALSLGVVGCRARRATFSVSRVTEGRDAAAANGHTTVGTVPDAAADAVRTGVSEPDCILDMGGGRRGSRTEIGPDAVLTIVHPQPRCWLAADCIRARGRSTPGDAMVSIDCRGRHCACAFEPVTPRRKRIRFSFDAENPCDDARLKSLLMERCVSEGRRRAATGRP
jgi:hypothetical protein